MGALEVPQQTAVNLPGLGRWQVPFAEAVLAPHPSSNAFGGLVDDAVLIFDPRAILWYVVDERSGGASPGRSAPDL